MLPRQRRVWKEVSSGRKEYSLRSVAYATKGWHQSSRKAEGCSGSWHIYLSVYGPPLNSEAKRQCQALLTLCRCQMNVLQERRATSLIPTFGIQKEPQRFCLLLTFPLYVWIYSLYILLTLELWITYSCFQSKIHVLEILRGFVQSTEQVSFTSPSPHLQHVTSAYMQLGKHCKKTTWSHVQLLGHRSTNVHQ